MHTRAWWGKTSFLASSLSQKLYFENAFISLKIWSLLNFRLLNQNLMVKRDKLKWELCYFDALVKFRISESCQKWSVTNRILRCDIADKVSKVVIFENKYLWVTFGKSFIFCIFMLIYLFLIPKNILWKVKFNNYIGSWTDYFPAIIDWYT